MGQGGSKAFIPADAPGLERRVSFRQVATPGQHRAVLSHTQRARPPPWRTLQRPVAASGNGGGQDGSVPGRRGHHVQQPTPPSPLRGPPRPGLVRARGKLRCQNTEGKTSYLREPPPTYPETLVLSQRPPRTTKSGLRKGKEARKHLKTEKSWKEEIAALP